MFQRPKFHRPKFQRPKKYLQTKQTYLMLRISKIHYLKMKLRKRPQPVLIYQNNANGRAQTKEKEPQKDLNVVWPIFYHERITSIFFLAVVLFCLFIFSYVFILLFFIVRFFLFLFFLCGGVSAYTFLRCGGRKWCPLNVTHV